MESKTTLLRRILDLRIFGNSDAKFSETAGYKGRSTVAAFRNEILTLEKATFSETSERMATTILDNLAEHGNIKSISQIEDIMDTAHILKEYLPYSDENLHAAIMGDMEMLPPEDRHRILNVRRDNFEAFYMGVALYMVIGREVSFSPGKFSWTVGKYLKIVDRIITKGRKRDISLGERGMAASRFGQEDVQKSYPPNIWGLIQILGTAMVQHVDPAKGYDQLDNLGEVIHFWDESGLWVNANNTSEVWHLECSNFSKKNAIYEAVRIPKDLDISKFHFVRMAMRHTDNKGKYEVDISNHPDTFVAHDSHVVTSTKASISATEIVFEGSEYQKVELPQKMILTDKSPITEGMSLQELRMLIVRASLYYAGIVVDGVASDVMVTRKKVAVTALLHGKERVWELRKSHHYFLNNIGPDDMVLVAHLCGKPESQMLIWATPEIFAIEI